MYVAEMIERLKRYDPIDEVQVMLRTEVYSPPERRGERGWVTVRRVYSDVASVPDDVADDEDGPVLELTPESTRAISLVTGPPCPVCGRELYWIESPEVREPVSRKPGECVVCGPKVDED